MSAAGARQIPGTDVVLSPVTLGTMRLDSAGDEAAAADLLAHALSIGISAFHCSAEYPSFELLLLAWRRARRSDSSRPAFIAKVATPHFGEDVFSAGALEAKVDRYLSALELDRLDVVQWLLRHDLEQEDRRLAIFRDQAEEISEAALRLKRSGKIGAFISFPYTPGIADAALAARGVDGLALYVNPLEHEMDALLPAAAAANKAVIAIRPFAAGRVFVETDCTAEDAIAYALAQEAVVTCVASASSRAHLDVLRPWLSPTT